MRPSLLLLAVLALASSCGGDWSNEDLVFLTALPDRAVLKSKLPDTSSGLTGIATRHDGLGVGQPSDAYASTLKAHSTFNGLLDDLLGVLDNVRAVSPTTRTSTARVWGPYSDSKNPGYQFQVVIAQQDAQTFSWAIQSGKSGSAFFDVLTGVFKAGASAKVGQGALVVPVKNFRDVLTVPDSFHELDEIRIGYVTDTYPHQVAMKFSFMASATQTVSGIGYVYEELADGSGQLAWEVTSTDPTTTVVDFLSRWLPSGAGVSQEAVKAGEAAGATQTECWGSDFDTRYFLQSWPGGQSGGTVTDCVSVPGFDSP
jgi:hypothetical protein